MQPLIDVATGKKGQMDRTFDISSACFICLFECGTHTFKKVELNKGNGEICRKKGERGLISFYKGNGEICRKEGGTNYIVFCGPFLCSLIIFPGDLIFPNDLDPEYIYDSW